MPYLIFYDALYSREYASLRGWNARNIYTFLSMVLDRTKIMDLAGVVWIRGPQSTQHS